MLPGKGRIVEIQGSAEKTPFSEAEFTALLRLAKSGVKDLVALQRGALGQG